MHELCGWRFIVEACHEPRPVKGETSATGLTTARNFYSPYEEIAKVIIAKFLSNESFSNYVIASEPRVETNVRESSNCLLRFRSWVQNVVDPCRRYRFILETVLRLQTKLHDAWKLSRLHTRRYETFFNGVLAPRLWYFTVNYCSLLEVCISSPRRDIALVAPGWTLRLHDGTDHCRFKFGPKI